LHVSASAATSDAHIKVIRSYKDVPLRVADQRPNRRDRARSAARPRVAPAARSGGSFRAFMRSSRAARAGLIRDQAPRSRCSSTARPPGAAGSSARAGDTLNDGRLTHAGAAARHQDAGQARVRNETTTILREGHVAVVVEMGRPTQDRISTVIGLPRARGPASGSPPPRRSRATASAAVPVPARGERRLVHGCAASTVLAGRL